VIFKRDYKINFVILGFWLQLASVRANGQKLSNMLVQHALENITAIWAFLGVDCAHHDCNFLGQLAFASVGAFFKRLSVNVF